MSPAGEACIAPDWLRAAPTQAVMAALRGEAWFVGGCVRNALLGLPATDVDLATPLEPKEVVRRLEAAGLRAVPTGIDHGTVTAVAEGKPYEITTFRADVETDGRRAVVAFTRDLEHDAARRDFTMNALYADAEGRIRDPVGGLVDLRAGRVRFIGEPELRIEEDRLRILRFYRFTAWYGAAGLDAEGREACAVAAPGMGILARERIGAEMRKLLSAPDPAAVVSAMAEDDVLDRCLPGHGEAGALARLIGAERAAGAAPDWRVRLAALSPATGEAEMAALRLSRAEARALDRLQALAESDLDPASMADAEGAEIARGAALLRAARRAGAPPGDLEAQLARGEAAEFPLAAADLIAAGVARGPALGAALAQARDAWRASGFALDREALLREVTGKGQ